MNDKKMVIYGALSMPLAISLLPFALYIPSMYITYYGLSIGYIGLILLIIRLIDVITDPIIGHLVDKFVLFGLKRKPWMVVGSILMGLSAFKVFSPNADLVTQGYFAFWVFMLYLGWTLIQIPYKALGSDISNNCLEKTKIFSYAEFFTVIGTVIAVSIPVFYTNDMVQSMGSLANIIVVLLIFSMILLLLFVDENKHNYKILNNHKKSWFLSYFHIFKALHFKRLIAVYFFNAVANSLAVLLVVFYIQNVLLKDPTIFILATFIATMVSFPVWIKVSKKIGKSKSWIIGLVLGCVAFLPIFWLNSENDDLYLILCIISGVGFAADAVFPQSMLSDIADINNAKNKTDSTAGFFSIFGVFTKLALAIPVGIAFPILSYFGFDSSANQVSLNGLTVLTILYGFMPFLLKLPSIYLLIGYPLDKNMN